MRTMGSLPAPSDPVDDQLAWDRDCAIAAAVLLGAGSVIASLNGEIELGQVCGVLGGLLAVVAASLWAAPRLSARRARRVAGRGSRGASAPLRDAAGRGGQPA